MKTLIRLSLLLLLWLVVARPDAQAQAEGTAFSCDGTFYQIRQVGTTSSLFRVNRSNTAYTTEPVNIVPAANNTRTNNLGVLLNGLAYNSQDGYMYALSTTGNTTTLPPSIQMYKIGQGGIQLLGTVTGIPNIQVASGTIDKNGNYYVSSQNSTGTLNYNLYRFDLKASTTAGKLAATALPLYDANNTAPVNLTFYDLAVNPQDNLLYAVFQNGTLWSIDPTTAAGHALVSPIKATANNNNPVGTAFFDVAGNLFAYTNGTVGTPNSAIFYSVDLTTGAYTQISTVDPASVSDGASCINPDQRIDVVKQVNSISRVGTTGQVFDIAFTLRIKNTSTTTDNNVQINDFLWSGTDNTLRANTTFSSVAGKLPTSVAIQLPTVVTADPTNVNSVFLLARNPNFTGVGEPAPGTGGALLTGTQPLTAGQAAIITFTVRVTYPSAASVPARLTNEAYASSTVGANPTGYRQDATSGFISSPDQLQATDRSTDGPSLPLAANGDTPIPSPIFFSRSISGTVFEDINYGGGAGRSQTVSRGLGAVGTRVELYSSAGAFLTFTTTDAAGNYAFSSTDGGTTELVAGTAYQVRAVNSSVMSNRPGSVGGLLAVQTFNNGTTNAVGGANPNNADAPANAGTMNGASGQSLTVLVTANAGSVVQTIASVSTPAATAVNAATTGIDFGFNFSTIVNTKNSGQGSLRQFILNSNALLNDNSDLATSNDLNQVSLPAGVETSIFMIPSSAGFSSGVAVINQTSALPPITDARTAINGKTQTSGISNTNAATLGTAGTVGTAATAFNKVAGPEIKIALAATIAGLTVTGNNATITGINLIGSNGNALTISGNNATVTDNALGSNATNNDRPGTRTPGSQINITAGSGSIISGNLIAFAGQSGVVVASGATNVVITDNEITNNGLVNVSADGLTLVSNGVRVTNNLITGNAGMGIDLNGSTGSASITGNTINGNGVGTTTVAPAETAGIRVAGTGNLLANNVLGSNYGAGILVASGASSTLISKNSTLGNGTVVAANNAVATNQLGIDLLTSADDANKGTSGYFSVNTNGKTPASGANGLLNFPIIFQATTFNGNLELTGYAPKGSTIEFFIAAGTADFGQGQSYLFTATEGATTGTVDQTARTGNYSGPINGIDQGSETGASIYVFTFPLSRLTQAQRDLLNITTTRLTATATLSNATSEFSGNTAIKPDTRPLPVTLVAFGAQAAGLNAQLSWKTAQELNNDHFVIERSFDGSSFVAVGQVKGQGSTQSATTYAYTDARVATQAPAGLVYYRLRQVDADGTEALSAVQTVRFSLSARVLMEVYPNPATATQDAKLDLSGAPAGSYQVTLLDLTGRTLRTFGQHGGTVQPLQLTGLPTGTYLVRVQGNGQSFGQRVVKQ